MTKKNVEDYLTAGMYGTRLPKQKERDYFLGTLRERIVIALTIGQVMTDKGLEALEREMNNHRDATLILNGTVANKFLKEEKELAQKYNISYTIITNESVDTNIGAVLTYDVAIDKENIFIKNEEKDVDTNAKEDSKGFFSKLFKF